MKGIWKILIFVAVLTLAILYVAVVMPRAAARRANVVCGKLDVQIVDSNINRFVRPEDVPLIFRADGLTYFGKKLGEISTDKLEAALNRRSFIKHADVYTTIDGTLHVRITQRHPIIRFYADNGDSFYFDDEGFVMQQYRTYTAYVPIVNGRVNSPFPRGFKGHTGKFFSAKRDASIAALNKLYERRKVEASKLSDDRRRADNLLAELRRAEQQQAAKRKAGETIDDDAITDLKANLARQRAKINLSQRQVAVVDASIDAENRKMKKLEEIQQRVKRWLAFATFLCRDKFWQSQIEQIYVTQSGDIELVPRVGAHIICLGTLDDFEYKLHKLRVMYEKGLPYKGWNTYNRIDLRFGKQVVCTKR